MMFMCSEPDELDELEECILKMEGPRFECMIIGPDLEELEESYPSPILNKFCDGRKIY